MEGRCGLARRNASHEAAAAVGSFKLSRDGALLVVSLEVFVDCDTLECTTRSSSRKKKAPSSGQVYDELFVRHWDTWADGRRSHLFVLPVAGGAPVDVMKRLDADSPIQAVRRHRGVHLRTRRRRRWSSPPATRARGSLVHQPRPLRRRRPTAEPPRNLTAANQARTRAGRSRPTARRSRSSRWSAPGFEADRLRIVAARRGRDGKDARRSPRRGIARPTDRWSADGKTLYATADDLGQPRSSPSTSRPARCERSSSDGHMRAAAAAPATGSSSASTRCARRRSCTRSRSTARAVKQLTTRQRRARWRDARIGRARAVHASPARNGEKVYGWVVKPVDFEPAKKYPVAFLIHGGPQGIFGERLPLPLEPADVRRRRLRRGDGRLPRLDRLRPGVHRRDQRRLGRQAARGSAEGPRRPRSTKYPLLDGDARARSARRYGGFMINWIAGNWPDRSSAWSPTTATSTSAMAYFDTEELWFPEWEHGGPPWENARGLRRSTTRSITWPSGRRRCW